MVVVVVVVDVDVVDVLVVLVLVVVGGNVVVVVVEVLVVVVLVVVVAVCPGPNVQLANTEPNIGPATARVANAISTARRRFATASTVPVQDRPDLAAARDGYRCVRVWRRTLNVGVAVASLTLRSAGVGRWSWFVRRGT